MGLGRSRGKASGTKAKEDRQAEIHLRAEPSVEEVCAKSEEGVETNYLIMTGFFSAISCPMLELQVILNTSNPYFARLTNNNKPERRAQKGRMRVIGFKKGILFHLWLGQMQSMLLRAIAMRKKGPSINL